MKLRIIVLILSSLAFLSTLTGGYFYYSALKSAAIERVERQGEWHAETIKNQFDQIMKNNQRAVRGLSGHDEVKQALVETNKATLDDANKVLDNFNTAFEASVSYLMDREGNTIASSNRKGSDSFVGKNYAFRPYFKQAIKGKPTVYVALGATSGKRGIYFSHAVYSNVSENPLGIVVMKAPVGEIENELLRGQFNAHGMNTFVTDSNNLIFMSGSDKYLFQLLEDIPDEKKSEIVNSKQFGAKLPTWSGFEIKSDSVMIDQPGVEYLFTRKEISTLPGWNLIHLHNKNEILKSIYAPLIGKLLPIILALCTFTGVAVFILYRMAHSDLKRRKAAENALMESEIRYRSLVESSSDHIFMFNIEGIYISSNNQVVHFGLEKAETVVGKHISDVYDQETAELYIEKMYQVIKTGKAVVFEHPMNQTNENRFHLDTLYPIFRNNEVWAVGGICRDITRKKKAEQQRENLISDLQAALKEVKQLKGMVPICSHCKSIRNDNGFWERVEGYINLHDEAGLSHGICPDCAEKYYPDMNLYNDE